MRILGAFDPDDRVDIVTTTWRRCRNAGSLIGSIAETQEMLDFGSRHGMTSDVDVIPMDNIFTPLQVRVHESPPQKALRDRTRRKLPPF